MSDPLTHFCRRAGDVTDGGRGMVRSKQSVIILFRVCVQPPSVFLALAPRINFGSFFHFFAPFPAFFRMFSL